MGMITMSVTCVVVDYYLDMNLTETNKMKRGKTAYNFLKYLPMKMHTFDFPVTLKENVGIHNIWNITRR